MLSIYDAWSLVSSVIACGLMGAVLGLFSWFLDYTFQPYSINKWYLPFLARTVLRHEPNIDILIKLGPDSYIPMAEDKFWFKVLGGCSVCFNIWLSLISWSLICFFSPFAWYFAFPYIMVSSFTIRRLVGAY